MADFAIVVDGAHALVLVTRPALVTAATRTAAEYGPAPKENTE